MPNNRYPITLILPAPERLEEFSDPLPDSVTAVLNLLAVHNASDIAELNEFLPEEVLVPELSADRVLLTRPKEKEYDEYFVVERSTDRPRLRLTLAFLQSLRAAALNASLGHDLEPAAMADLLKSIRVMASLLGGAAKGEITSGGAWPNGTWPNGPW